MANIGLILLVFAFVIACIAMRVPAIGAFLTLPMAIALWIAADLIGGLGKTFH
jgi:hypothetical protein